MITLDEAIEVLEKALEHYKALFKDEILLGGETKKLIDATELSIKALKVQEFADAQFKELLQEVRE